jgi:acyl-CoA-binding protein
VSTSADFEAAQARVKTLKSTPSPDELLELYALFKQGTQGDVTGSRPGMLDFKGRAKFDAWEKRKGLARDAAQRAYVELVATLEARYGLRLPE